MAALLYASRLAASCCGRPAGSSWSTDEIAGTGPCAVSAARPVTIPNSIDLRRRSLAAPAPANAYPRLAFLGAPELALAGWTRSPGWRPPSPPGASTSSGSGPEELPDPPPNLQFHGLLARARTSRSWPGPMSRSDRWRSTARGCRRHRRSRSPSTSRTASRRSSANHRPRFPRARRFCCAAERGGQRRGVDRRGADIRRALARESRRPLRDLGDRLGGGGEGASRGPSRRVILRPG